MLILDDGHGRAFHLMIEGRPYILKCRVGVILHRRNITVKQYAAAIKISKNAAYDILNNRYCMSFETALKSAWFLGCAIDELYTLYPII